MSTPQTIPGYIKVTITNNSKINENELYIFLQSQTEIYQISKTDRKASIASPPSSTTGKATTTDAPSISLASLKQNGEYAFFIDQSQKLKSGRMYFSDSASAVQITSTNGVLGSINGPSPTAPFIFDFVELTIKGNEEVNLDTTQIDQFGMPITVQVTPGDTNFPNGTGIKAGTKRSTVISNFNALCGNTAFAPYKNCAQPIPARAAVPAKGSTPAKPAVPASHRLIGPQHLIDTLIVPNQFKGDVSNAATGTPNTATFTLTTANQNFGAITGWVASGPGVPPGATVKSVASNQLTLESTTGEFVNITGVQLWFYEKHSDAIINSMDDAIHQMFTYYKTHKLYMVANGTNSGTEVYEGEVITDFVLPDSLPDINGNVGTKYCVFQFKGTGYRYDDASNVLTKVPGLAAGETNVYQVFYPYFSTNCVSAPGGNALTKRNPPAPPVWFKHSWGANIPATDGGPLGDINIVSPATQMALGCAGTFADSSYQSWAYHASSNNKLQDATVLGNIENQLVTMLNRGISPNTGSGNNNLQLKLGYITHDGLDPIDLSKLTSVPATAPAAPTSTPGAMTKFSLGNPVGTGIPVETISGNLYLSGTLIQTFTIDAAGTATFKKNGTPANYATGLSFDSATSTLTINWYNAVNISAVTAEISFSYGNVLSDRYATLQFLDPNKPTASVKFTNDLGKDNTDIEVGMQMTTTSEFSQPMEVYYVNSDKSSIILKSPMPFQPFNAGILLFSNFYPMNKNTPDGAWNMYSYYFHNGNLGTDIPTIDGRGYAFPFDDNGGYSSDLDVTMTASTVVGIDVTLNETV
ncbi:hypothetical protein BFP97_11245 [Roseivirga sp. 4D4]|uniref:beta-1,3-glucanase family protein n=1 Tax=Roseivirga sp. 4D4 TaxID=1889784 RepID=UPI000853318F|nr:beta-1,3-glucanase family protein [Roseivirga sp. 4D4]OEK02061.1 hypothetical protein BFP97_11245 [Roseivirga sp. 4D4]